MDFVMRPREILWGIAAVALFAWAGPPVAAMPETAGASALEMKGVPAVSEAPPMVSVPPIPMLSVPIVGEGITLTRPINLLQVIPPSSPLSVPAAR